MKMMSLILFIFFTTFLLIATAKAELYDNFESGSLNRTKWNTSATPPTIQSETVYEGSYAMESVSGATFILKNQTLNNSIVNITFWTNLADLGLHSDAWTLWGSTGIEDGSGNNCFIFNGNYPTAGYFGYYNYSDATQHNTGVNSTLGNTDIAGDWKNVRLILNNKNLTINLQVGNGTSGVDNYTTIANYWFGDAPNCGQIASIQGYATGGDTARYDNFSVTFIENIPPVIEITNINASDNIKYSDRLNISAYITNSDLKLANFTFNLTGKINLYNFPYSISGIVANLSQNITINLTRGNVINASVVACDLDNNCSINSILVTIANTFPVPNNVSITPSSPSTGDSLKGHGNYTDIDGDLTGGNQTRWYANESIINEANNSFNLLGGNVTTDANITFSIRYNDTFDWSNWTNSSTILVGDLSSPIVTNQTISGTSFITTDLVNISITVTDNSGNIQYCRAELNVSGSTFSNITLTSLGNNVFADARTYALGFHNISYFYCADNNGNIAQDQSNFTFTVSNPPSGGGSSPSGGGGGGGATKTIIIKEGIPLLSFGGLTLIDFNVLTTPSKKVKIVRFKNVGNVTFANAKVSIEGNAKKYVKPFICNLNLQNCMNESISIKAGESMFLTLNGTFTDELGEGTNGIIKIQEMKDKGVAHELNLLISRPPLYNIAVKPLANLMGIPELLAFVVVYVATGVAIIGSIWLATIM